MMVMIRSIEIEGCWAGGSSALGLQIAQSRSYLYSLGPKVSVIYILAALGHGEC